MDYDKTDAKSIERYAHRLVGHTFREVVEADRDGFSSIEDVGYKNKGSLGNLLEERYFHYGSNTDSAPDFPEAGVELKTTPYRLNTRGKKVAKERLVITMINYMKVINETFDDSHLWLKSRLMLLVYYFYRKEISNRLDYRIDYVSLFTPSKEDLKIIKEDYKKIVDKIRSGLAHELSEADTMYLAACTKGSSASDECRQPNSNVLTKPRAFSFKSSYMSYILNNHVIPVSSALSEVYGLKSSLRQDEPDAIVPEGKSVALFEQYVCSRINKYSGRTKDELCGEFNITRKTSAKNLGAIIAYRILGVRSNSAEEFIKAGIKVKTIRVNQNDTITQNMSFPAMVFTEVANESWEESAIYKTLEGTRYFFVVYKYDEHNKLRLLGCKFWNIPREDLLEVKKVWERTKQLINGGLVVEKKNGKYKSNFPKITENRVCHVRPHARNAEDVDKLPNGTSFPKQSFWLNHSYILSQIKDLL